jgi:hypothetical protein
MLPQSILIWHRKDRPQGDKRRIDFIGDGDGVIGGRANKRRKKVDQCMID